jgi:DNA-directed RNA polymerase specialized sigma24 family protein
VDGGTTGFAKRLRPLRRLSDDELAAAAASGDQRAVGVIVERYHEPLYSYCAAILRNPEQAAEALQMTTLAAMEGLKEGQRSIPLRAWLYSLARQESLELLAARSPRHSTGGNGLGARLTALPEPQRSALLFRELGGLEYAEIAAALDIGTNAARQAALNARRQLESAGPDRTPECAAIRTEMSVNEGRFERRRDIREHLGTCPDCSAFAASLGERPHELRSLFALPAGVAAAVIEGAGEPAIGAEEAPERARHATLLALLLLAVALGSVAALAALGTFDSGSGSKEQRGSAGPGATQVDVAPGSGVPGTARHGGRNGGSQGKRSQSRQQQGQQGALAQQQGSPVAPAQGGVPPGAVPSAVSAYTTPGERTEGLLGAP